MHPEPPHRPQAPSQQTLLFIIPFTQNVNVCCSSGSCGATGGVIFAKIDVVSSGTKVAVVISGAKVDKIVVVVATVVVGSDFVLAMMDKHGVGSTPAKQF